MNKLTYLLYIFSTLLISIYSLFLIFSIGILSKNSQDIDLISAIVAIFLAIILTWLLDMIDDLYERIDELETEIKKLKRKV